MVSKAAYNVAIVGATGAVGQTIIKILEERNFPIDTLKLLSSSRSAGKKVQFKNKEIIIEEATPESFSGIDIALFSAGGSVSKRLASSAVGSGAVVVDNTSAFRMDENVPLVVPEVNAEDIKTHQGIIANPNCSTIQMVAALKPIQKAFGLKRVIVSTYQAVSGAGAEATDELEEQSRSYLENEEMETNLLPVKGDKKHYPIAFNALPHMDMFTKNGNTLEVTDLWNVLKEADGVVLEDDPENQIYPTPLSAANKDDVFVGRVRKDLDQSNGFHFWVVADNLIKGAALNTVQIAEKIIKD